MSMPIDLVHLTGCDRVYWVRRIQELIPLASSPTRDPNHDTTNTPQWLGELSKEVFAAVNRTYPQPFDENIITSMAMTLILATWGFRVSRAKQYDPARPVEIRQRSTKRLLGLKMGLLEAIEDESLDHIHFPGQEWDPPFAPNAKDGTFV